MQVGVEEQEVVVFPAVLLSKALLVVVFEKEVDGLNGGQVALRFALLVAPETRLPGLQLYPGQALGVRNTAACVSLHAHINIA